ncbi:cupin-like domain-domain-containing protein [Catenaria anguillulae PL171]|uniref:Cupin-like domain-domain-containing protein n=1 Tax=Catenaria anguillulae PL171 TaxID=765915 RepID=A0A1Y2HU83_9FUNG|nr:cupin-like domain-domain-containing protein [Catenaria anguillulae PL171]
MQNSPRNCFKMHSPSMDTCLLEKALIQLSSTVNDLCLSSQVQIFEREPTPIEFLRLIHANRPVLFKGVASSFPAMRKWTPEYMAAIMQERTVTVSLTPTGFADAPLANTPFFVEPFDARVPFHSAMNHLMDTHTHVPAAPELPQLAHATYSPISKSVKTVATNGSTTPVAYMQTQNGCLADPDEWKPLLDTCDVPTDIAWASEALGAQPDAVNLWIGPGAAATAVHKDPYENLYAVVSGTKTFKLWPPSDAWRMEEQAMFEVVVDNPDARVPWIVAPPPDAPCIEVQVHAGDMLYLPSQWFHAVYQRPAPPQTNPIHPLVIAVNWWYDIMDYSFAYAHLQLVRSLGYVMRTGDLPKDHASMLLDSSSDDEGDGQ